MENLKTGKLAHKLVSAIAALALSVTTLNANTTCMLIAHQPKLPDSAKKLRRF